jgi:hypothetical protein
MEEVIVTKDRWKNRRRMAWTTLIAGCLYPLLVLFTSSDQLGSIAGPFYVFVAGVIAVYIGAAVVDDNNFKDKE